MEPSTTISSLPNEPAHLDVRVLLQREKTDNTPVFSQDGEPCGKGSSLGEFKFMQESTDEDGNRLLIYRDTAYVRYRWLPYIGSTEHPGEANYRLVMATNNYAPIGQLNIITLTWSKQYAYLSGLYVESDFRRKGHARALLRTAYSFLQDRARQSIVLDVHHGMNNKPAVALYESEGFKRDISVDHYVMVRPLVALVLPEQQ